MNGIEDCVQGVCQCSNRAHLPKPQSVNYIPIRSPISSSSSRDAESDRSYQLNWSYEQPIDGSNISDEDLASFISVRVEKAEQVLALGVVYRQVREFRHPVERTVRNQQHFRQIIHHLEPRYSFRIRIAALDAHHCEGEIADIYFNRKLNRISFKKMY